MQGMTQEELADAANLFRTYMSRIESGHANPSLTVIHSLASALSVPPGQLLTPPSQDFVAGAVRSRAPVSRGRISR